MAHFLSRLLGVVGGGDGLVYRVCFHHAMVLFHISSAWYACAYIFCINPSSLTHSTGETSNCDDWSADAVMKSQFRWLNTQMHTEMPLKLSLFFFFFIPEGRETYQKLWGGLVSAWITSENKKDILDENGVEVEKRRCIFRSLWKARVFVHTLIESDWTS